MLVADEISHQEGEVARLDALLRGAQLIRRVQAQLEAVAEFSTDEFLLIAVQANH